jgi:hypothetical protein
MKKIGLGIIIFVFVILFSVSSIFAEVRINEVELNPAGSDAGHEWVELYSDNLVDLNGWKLVNHDNKNKMLDGNLQGYLVINLDGQWLDNENESLNLFNSEGSLISFTPILKDSTNNDKTWSYCGSNSWSLVTASPEAANNCANQNNNSNDTQNPQNNTQNLTIVLKLEWTEEDIKNGKEFRIKVKADNLKDKNYDIKMLIYNDDIDNPISETYSDSSWGSSKSYVKDFLKGPGSDSGYIKLRIKESQRIFYGSANVVVMIRGDNSNSYESKFEDDINIIKSDESDLNNISISNIGVNNEIINNAETNNPVSGDVIRLNNKNYAGTINLNKNLIYESSNEKIKKYSLYSFGLLIIIMIITLFAGYIRKKRVFK